MAEVPSVRAIWGGNFDPPTQLAHLLTRTPLLLPWRAELLR
jgi:hypothetical protein